MQKPDQTTSIANRGKKCEIRLKNRTVCYAENGQRSVPLEKTIKNIGQFFLRSPIEVQFTFIKNKSGKADKAFLKYHSPFNKKQDQHYFGKGLSSNQNFASACFEFIERYCARMRPGDVITESSFDELIDLAIDPQHFNLAENSSFLRAKKIDWVWGYSLSRKVPVLVPANLVFCPYLTSNNDKYIVMSDSNGLASGNNMEEAILHGLLEIIERDQVFISEYNRLPFKRIIPESVPGACKPTIDRLTDKGYQVSILSGTTDIPVPFMAAFIQHKKNPSNCSVAYGSYPDPALAIERALTEAIQLLPPSNNHKKWLKSGSPQFYLSSLSDEIHFTVLKNRATLNIKENIEILVSILKEIESEVIAVNLSQSEIPFPSVRIMATKLQPYINKDSLRLSQRFFDVPVKLGFRNQPILKSEVKIWPICGYK
jgi:ribosomal protein S12 methylthiotransferase accessory factor YcaO